VSSSSQVRSITTAPRRHGVGTAHIRPPAHSGAGPAAQHAPPEAAAAAVALRTWCECEAVPPTVGGAGPAPLLPPARGECASEANPTTAPWLAPPLARSTAAGPTRSPAGVRCAAPAAFPAGICPGGRSAKSGGPCWTTGVACGAAGDPAGGLSRSSSGAPALRRLVTGAPAAAGNVRTGAAVARVEGAAARPAGRSGEPCVAAGDARVPSSWDLHKAPGRTTVTLCSLIVGYQFARVVSTLYNTRTGNPSANTNISALAAPADDPHWCCCVFRAQVLQEKAHLCALSTPGLRVKLKASKSSGLSSTIPTKLGVSCTLTNDTLSARGASSNSRMLFVTCQSDPSHFPAKIASGPEPIPGSLRAAAVEARPGKAVPPRPRRPSPQ
jgi:hypothetical protein